MNDATETTRQSSNTYSGRRPLRRRVSEGTLARAATLRKHARTNEGREQRSPVHDLRYRTYVRVRPQKLPSCLPPDVLADGIVWMADEESPALRKESPVWTTYRKNGRAMRSDTQERPKRTEVLVARARNTAPGSSEHSYS